MANGFIVAVILHVAGIIQHTIRNRDFIGLAMVDGKKEGVSESDEIPSSRPLVGVILLGLVVGFGVTLFKGYDSTSRRLDFFGTSLQLGENEGNGNENAGREESEHEDSDD
jgi:hypothetical protein